MKHTATDPVHALIVPLAQVSLLIPSALVAEVVNISPLSRVPLGPSWLLGAFAWRSRPVPVISFEGLSGGAADIESRTKVVVFYPLQGRRPWEFFGVLANGEPQPRTFHDAQAFSVPVDNKNPYLAATYRMEQWVVGIPELSVLRQAFYPAG